MDAPKPPPFSVREFSLACALPVMCLLPFLGKAYHIDDTFYLFVAEQILKNPLDFYGFDISWGVFRRPAYELNMNPPGVSYVLAAVAALFGWREVVHHGAMAIVTGALGGGTYLVARRMCARPLIAALLAVLTPAVLVSGNTVMSDMPMVTLYVWALWLWMKGLDEERRALLVLAGVLIGLSSLTKYFGITCIPLLFAYTVARRRRVDVRVLYLTIPIAMFAAYQWYAWRLYDVNLFTNAADFALDRSWSADRFPTWAKPVAGLSFLGACTASVLFVTPWLWGWRRAGLVGGAWVAVSALLYGLAGTGLYPGREPAEHLALYVPQYALMIVGGVQVLVMLVLDLWKRRDAASLLLGCWIVGTLLFSVFVNWTINVRTLLPLVPAVGILAAQQIELFRPDLLLRRMVVPLGAAATLCFCVLWGDYRHAASARTAAEKFLADRDESGHTYYFKGHWGFQYYMEHGGAEPFRSQGLALGAGDRIVVPVNNDVTGRFNPAVARAYRELSLTLPASRWITTNHSKARAGFYLHFYGELPYVFGPAPLEEYGVYELGDYQGRAARGETLTIEFFEGPEDLPPTDP